MYFLCRFNSDDHWLDAISFYQIEIVTIRSIYRLNQKKNRFPPIPLNLFLAWICFYFNAKLTSDVRYKFNITVNVFKGI